MVFMVADTLEAAIDLVNASRFGNAASIYTSNLRTVNVFRDHVRCGNIGINIGVPAPIAFFPFAGMKESFLGIVHGQSTDAFRFFTDVKVWTERA